MAITKVRFLGRARTDARVRGDGCAECPYVATSMQRPRRAAWRCTVSEKENAGGRRTALALPDESLTAPSLGHEPAKAQRPGPGEEPRTARPSDRDQAAPAAGRGRGEPADRARVPIAKPRRAGDRGGVLALRVCPKTSGGITKFSEHEAD